MAKVKGALHSDSASGKFGEYMIFRKGKKSTTVTGKYKPGSKNFYIPSESQLLFREKYGKAVESWRALSFEEKEIFNGLARLSDKHISGWNLFFKQFEVSPLTHLFVHYKMNDNSEDTNVVDNINSYNATSNLNTSIITTLGKINGALYLTNNKIMTPVLNLGMSAVSFSCWFKLDTFDGDIKVLFMSDNIGYVGVGGDFSGYPWTSRRLVSWSSIGYIISNEDLFVDTWYHFAIVSDGSQAELFLNGVSQGTSSSGWFGSNDQISIGARNYDDGYNFTGIIDDFRIYKDYKLSQSEILAIYNEGNGTENDNI